MKKIHSDLILFLTKACEEYKKYTDCHRSPEKDYAVGSYVYLTARNLKLKIPSKKLGPKKIGPLKVLEKFSSLHYRLELPTGSSVHNVFHVDLLTPYDGDPNNLEGRNPDPQIVSNTFEWEVEDINDSCQVKEKSQFLIK